MYFINEITLGEILNIIVLAGTAFIVWLYTKAAQKTNEIQEQPAINLTLTENNNGVNTRYTLKVKNVGRAPAYNVIFSPLISGQYTYHPYFRDEANPVLEVGNEHELHFWVKKSPNSTEAYERILGFQFFLQRFFPQNADQTKHEELKRTSAIFVFNYEGINGKKYHSVFRIYSKIWPLLGIYDLVSELIRIAEGRCIYKEAKMLCSGKETIPKFPTQ